MRILKRIFLVLVALIAIILIAGLFMNKEYALEKEVTVNEPRDSVYQYLKHIKNQDKFSVWNQKDPKSKRTFTGTDGEVGFVYAWDSTMDDVGAGEMEIKKLTENERIDLELRFKRPFEDTGHAYFVTESETPAKTKVKWGFRGAMPYPMNVLMPFMNMDEMMGKDLQQGLENMKTNLEKK